MTIHFLYHPTFLSFLDLFRLSFPSPRVLRTLRAFLCYPGYEKKPHDGLCSDKIPFKKPSLFHPNESLGVYAIEEGWIDLGLPRDSRLHSLLPHPSTKDGDAMTRF